MTKEKENEVGKMGQANTLLERLQQASNEIDMIKNTFSKNMTDLEKIQHMLSFDDINKFTSMIQDYEARLSESVRQRDEASEGARKYSQELEKEKERLMKLWDAYKTQEEELSTQEKKTSQLESHIHDLEQNKTQLEKDLTTRIMTLTKKLEESEAQRQQVTMYRQQMQEFDAVREQMEHEIRSLKTEVHAKNETIGALEQRIQQLNQYEAYAEYKTKYDELCKDYDKEKERLTKLFRLYEETEAECNSLKKEVTDWQNWFNENEELFNRLFSSVEHMKRTSPVEQTVPEPQPVEEPAVEHEEVKTKKRLRFRK